MREEEINIKTAIKICNQKNIYPILIKDDIDNKEKVFFSQPFKNANLISWDKFEEILRERNLILVLLGDKLKIKNKNKRR
jgi:hypothetical protein